MSKTTVGEASLKLKEKAPDSRCPIEIERALHKDYEVNVHECIARAKKEAEGDFFVVVLTKKEPLMDNVLRHYFFWRVSCPTPDYDQTVYHYKSKDATLDFLWVVPSRETCFTLKENKHRVVPAEYGLLEFVLKFDDGTLRRLAKKLNNEADDSSELTT